MSNSAAQELMDIVRQTDSIRQIISDLEQEPLRLLCAVGKECSKAPGAIPDHRLGLNNYFAEAALRALVSAGLLKMQVGGNLAIYEYEMTEKGAAIYGRLVSEGVCKG